jgi:hypothetical protein
MSGLMTAQPEDDLDELGRIEAARDSIAEAEDDAIRAELADADGDADDLGTISAPHTGVTTLPGAASAIVLEDNVPMPEESERPQNPVFYPWQKMLVGQSFFVPRRMKNPRATLVRAQQSTGFKLTHRVVTENGVRGVRFWRVG